MLTMKKITNLSIAAVLFFIGFSANAQTDQGGWFVGASTNISFNSTSFDVVDDNVNTFNISGRAGYFLMDNLAGGLSVSFSSFSFRNLTETDLSIGPFARYYFNGTVFAGVGYAFQNSTLDDGVTDISESGGQLSFEVGYPIWVVDVIAIEPAINYSVGTGDLNRDTSTFGVAIGFDLYF